MRVAIGGILHESNTFNPAPTGLAAFCVQRDADIITSWRGTHNELGGFIEGGARFGYETIPTLVAEATPSGRVTSDAFEALTRELVDRVIAARPLDGLLLALHGAMVSEVYPDADGEVVRRFREVLGKGFPIVVTHDFHANVSEEVVRETTALVIYKTNPHLDQRERGLQAAEIASRIIRGEVKPVQSLAKPPMLLNIVHQCTTVQPMKTIMQAVRSAEENSRVLAASVAAGYQYGDVWEMGPSAVVVADDDDLARSEAMRISDMLWGIRNQLGFDLLGAAEAVRQAKGAERTPVVLVEMGDNIGGGSAGDSTFVLGELLRQNAEGWVVVLADPKSVQECAAANIGAAITLRVGGNEDNLHGGPVEVNGRVKCLHDGQFQETEPRHGGRRYHDQGLTAVLDMGHSESGVPSLLVLTTHREAPMSLHQLLSVGIQPERQKILVVKAAIAYRAAYEAIAGHIIQVDTPGLTAVNPARFVYRNVRRPMWGLDAES